MRDLESDRRPLLPESDFDLRPGLFVTLDGDLSGDLEILLFARSLPPETDTDLSLEDDLSLTRPDLLENCFGVLERLCLDFVPLAFESERDLDLERDGFFSLLFSSLEMSFCSPCSLCTFSCLGIISGSS